MPFRKLGAAPRPRAVRLRIMFADEARFGRINCPQPCWAPTGGRPKVASQLVREFTYLYGAVSPKDGACRNLIMPAADIECFQIFLDALAKKFPAQYILLFVDAAGNHGGGNLVIPANIKLECPPTRRGSIRGENLWDEIREKIFKDYALKSMERSMTSSRSGALPRAQCRNCQIHNLVSLCCQIILIRKWY
jgi:hypothetical protein